MTLTVILSRRVCSCSLFTSSVAPAMALAMAKVMIYLGRTNKYDDATT